MRGRKPKTLTKRQTNILDLLALYTDRKKNIEKSIKFWTHRKKMTKRKLESLWKKAEEERIPITQVAKTIGISRVAVHLRYKKFKLKGGENGNKKNYRTQSR